MFVGYKKADHFSIQPSDQGPQEGLKGCQGVFKFSEKKPRFWSEFIVKIILKLYFSDNKKKHDDNITL